MYTVEYYEYDWQQNQIAQGIFNTENKIVAWKEFEKSIAEHYHGKDFWTDFNWNDNLVESIHDAEDGYNVCLLHKWEGFDDDICLSWECEGKLYKSIQDLWEARPDFKDCTKECDKTYIVNKDNTATANLVITIDWRHTTNCQPINTKRIKQLKQK